MKNNFEMSSIEPGYDAYHKKGRDLLEDLYDGEEFDQIMGSFLHDDKGLRAELGSLEEKLNSAKNEEKKNKIRKEWMKKNNLLKELLNGTEGKE